MKKTDSVCVALCRSFILAAVLSLVHAETPASAAPTREVGAPTFRRGISIYPFMWPRRPVGADQLDTPTFDPASFPMSKHDFDELDAMGIDFIRFPIELGPFVESPTNVPNFLQQIKSGLDLMLASHLKVILDIHPPGSSKGSYADVISDDDSRRSYLSAVGALADLLSGYPQDRVMLELMNEPNSPCDDAKWPNLAKTAFVTARRHAHALYVVMNGSCYSSIQGLEYVRIADFDARTFYTFHYYEPYVFTHQGAPWASYPAVRYLNGIIWPPSSGGVLQSTKSTSERIYGDRTMTAAQKADIAVQSMKLIGKYYAEPHGAAAIDADFKKVSLWAATNKIPAQRIILGEFGVLKDDGIYKGADMLSAANWLTEMRVTAERHHFSWCMWNYGEGMALVSGTSEHRPYAEIVRALGLKAAPGFKGGVSSTVGASSNRH